MSGKLIGLYKFGYLSPFEMKVKSYAGRPYKRHIHFAKALLCN